MKKVNIIPFYEAFQDINRFNRYVAWEQGGYDFIHIFSRTDDPGEEKEFLEEFLEECSIEDIGSLETVLNLLKTRIQYPKCFLTYNKGKGDSDDILRMHFCYFTNPNS
jgi:hypothetical protein